VSEVKEGGRKAEGVKYLDSLGEYVTYGCRWPSTNMLCFRNRIVKMRNGYDLSGEFWSFSLLLLFLVFVRQ